MPFFPHFTRLMRWGASLLLAVLGCILLWNIAQRLEYNIYDTYARWSSRQSRPESKSPTRLILIDDESIERLRPQYGLPPWSRQSYVDIFRRIQQYKPATTVFDGHFMYFQRENDRTTFESLRQIPNLILGVVHQNTQSDKGISPNQWLEKQAGNYYLLNLGVVNILPDAQDGILRNINPIWPPTEATPGVFPALSLAAALDYLRQQKNSADWVIDWQEAPRQEVILYSENNPAINRHFPLHQNGNLLLHWKRLLSTQEKSQNSLSQLGLDISHPAYPLWKVLQASSPKEIAAIQNDLAGQIIIIGSASSIYQDAHHTPVSIRHSGADIQATAIDNFLGLKPIYPLPTLWQLPICIGLFLGAGALRIMVRNPQHSLLYTLGSMAIYGWLAYWLFYRYQVWIPVATPEISLGLGFIIANIWLSLMQDKEVALLEGHLSRLVSQSVFQEIRQMSRIITQGGRKLDITAMMVDIRNFTSLAESLPPQQVSNLLNEFYELVVSTVFKHRGTVDKFLGDGVMILFGAPVPDVSHAQDATMAALELVAASGALIEKWKQERSIDTEIGISLHSGSAFVGFIGPKNKLEYTAIGDTINICARLQEQSKAFNSAIVVSQDTLLQCSQHQQHFKPLGPVQIRGRDTAIDIWALK